IVNQKMRPTSLEVNLPQLRKNIEAIRAHVTPAKVMAMVKANAYGHGVDGVAPFIEPIVDYFGVAILEEGIYLRELGITKPILVAGGTLPEQIPEFIVHDLILTVSSPDLLASVDAAAESAKKKLIAHLKIDTGMERIGVHYYEAESFLEQSLKCRNIEIEGIYTHLANSEERDLIHARLQLERFQNVLRFYEKRSLPTPIRHIANSGAVLQFPESHLDMVRPGLMLYGVYPVGVSHTVEIEPALIWRSRVAYSKITRPGYPVSYGSLWQAEAETRIVTIPCGYADGYFRRMTNQAQVIVNGKKYPQVGRICMDQFMVNVGADIAEVGDEVVLLGEGITAYDLAEWTGTNEYEVLTNINTRVPRVYLKE
ncbi:MAG: alanine racemase, partial [Anaerolineae bacterium]|nr:alanine racemase [Anaerolineae bacterium]